MICIYNGIGASKSERWEAGAGGIRIEKRYDTRNGGMVGSGYFKYVRWCSLYEFNRRYGHLITRPPPRPCLVVTRIPLCAGAWMIMSWPPYRWACAWRRPFWELCKFGGQKSARSYREKMVSGVRINYPIPGRGCFDTIPLEIGERNMASPPSPFVEDLNSLWDKCHI